MDRRAQHRSPEGEGEAAPVGTAAEPLDALSEAELDRILPPIDEDDPAWQAYVREKIRESLDDPRPDIPAEEAFAEVDRHIAEYKAKRGL
ncbi:MAG: hypothetical protein QOE79_469 [Sphingomonadales bacterium]|jgi:hypothetical protein|nr:hypothetical protein [Sphingomonadales bacterium]MEA3048767.1 hypothetical protein [Sphingomonadales bacterium]